MTIDELLQSAAEHHDAGRLAEAEALYRQVLAQEPANADALFYFALLRYQQRQKVEALDLIERAIAVTSDRADFYSTRASILSELDRPDDAIIAWEKAIARSGGDASSHAALAGLLRKRGRVDEAIIAYKSAAKIKPDFGILSALATLLITRSRFAEAETACRDAVRVEPSNAEALNNLGIVLKAMQRNDEAAESSRRAIELRPNYAKAYCNLSAALHDLGRLDEATEAAKTAVRLDDGLAEAHNCLGIMQMDAAEHEPAIAEFKRAIDLKPDWGEPHTNLIFTILRDDRQSTDSLSVAHRRWYERQVSNKNWHVRSHDNDKSPDRRLRIGYVSPDLRWHVVGWNLLPLLSTHDHERFEVFCYASVRRPDDMTARLRSCADHWRDIVGVDDDRAAEMIREDRIDILVDLTLHMAGNRLLVFARKPAPIQATYLGYCGTSGMQEMDYRLSDPYLDPPDMPELGYCETTLRLPRTYWCYEPADVAPDCGPLPALTAGHVTFASMNNFSKASACARDLWARVLLAVPGSRLLVHSQPGSHRDRMHERLVSAGVEVDRVEFIAQQPWDRYIRTYYRIDIALDTFPYGGGITSCDGLWMGVPLVTLAESTPVGRGGSSILNNLGMPELIAKTPAEYVRIATTLAADLPRLSAIRAGLRERMAKSPLRDPKAFARDVENAYRQIWRQYCAK